MPAHRADDQNAFARAEIAWDTGDLHLGNGLLVILQHALGAIQPGDAASFVSSNTSGIDDMRAWCKTAGHELSWSEDGHKVTYKITKGTAKSLLIDGLPDWGLRAQLDKEGKFPTNNWLIGRHAIVPDEASTNHGFAPRGALTEAHSPAFPFSENRKTAIWAKEVAELYDQAVNNQWDAATAIQWQELPALPEPLERAVCQLMTFLVENEYSALYVPGKFISRINPQFTEVVLFLTTQMMDEARHIEVFTKRALANGGGLQVCTASTEHSLKSLLDQNDFSCASFLLSVLGEGTFLDLLRFIEENAPDQVTSDIARRARVDETRHVHFGMAHIRYLLEETPDEAEKLMQAVRQRALVLANVTSLNEHVIHALTVMSGGGLEPQQLKKGSALVSEMLQAMDDNRRRRLTTIGFSAKQAAEISALHTANFM